MIGTLQENLQAARHPPKSRRREANIHQETT
jgi:hypothetical protein